MMAILLSVMLSGSPVQPEVGTPEFSAPILTRDARGHSKVITIGLDPRATYGFDSLFGEMPIPPIPPVPVLDVRLEDPEGRKQYQFDGSWTDIRPLEATVQRDTFFVRYQAADDAFPIQFNWNSADFQGFARAVVIGARTGGPMEVNLKNVSMLSIPDGEYSTIRIVLEGYRRP